MLSGGGGEKREKPQAYLRRKKKGGKREKRIINSWCPWHKRRVFECLSAFKEKQEKGTRRARDSRRVDRKHFVLYM